jgi:hypothetical protein
MYFNLSLSQKNFPALWKQVEIVPVFKKGNGVSDSSCRPISFLDDLPNYLKLLFMTTFRMSEALASMLSLNQNLLSLI